MPKRSQYWVPWFNVQPPLPPIHILYMIGLVDVRKQCAGVGKLQTAEFLLNVPTPQWRITKQKTDSRPQIRHVPQNRILASICHAACCFFHLISAQQPHSPLLVIDTSQESLLLEGIEFFQKLGSLKKKKSYFVTTLSHHPHTEVKLSLVYSATCKQLSLQAMCRLAKDCHPLWNHRQWRLGENLLGFPWEGPS